MAAPLLVIDAALHPELVTSVDSFTVRVVADPVAGPDLCVVADARPEAGTDLDVAVERVGDALLVAMVNLRPAAARVATIVRESACERVLVVAVGYGEEVAADSVWAAGCFIRILLDELACESTLTESAGIAITVAQSHGDPVLALSRSARLAAYARAREEELDVVLRRIVEVDSVGNVPTLTVAQSSG
jgi:hypothetical protein